MGHRLLLVDDEPELLRALSVRLSAAGFICDTANNGREALEKLEGTLPDLVVVDLLMPEVSGYEVCRQLKENDRTARIPVIVLTAVPERTVGRAAEWLGVERVLYKPFDSKLLVATVQELLRIPSPGGPTHG